ncbi:MAG TPA: EutN/CcmL family microcompartment protein [Planctomycetaceae bacterium]|nr:EutN/CcmL family microcompartment protein [Planctomycetaceae bacterium]
MRVAETIGKVTLNKSHATVRGATWLLAVPLTLDGIAGKVAGRGEPIVVFDELGAGLSSRIAVSEGTEAAAPFYPEQKPIDAYNAAILDTLEFEPL